MADISTNGTPNRRIHITGPFSATQNPKVETLKREFRKTMPHKTVELSYESMMERFLPPMVCEPAPNHFNKIFDKVPTGTEANMYDPLVNALNRYATKSIVAKKRTTRWGAKKRPTKTSVHKADGQFVVVATDALPDKTDPTRRKVDLGMYPKGSAAVLEKRTNWSTIELSIEVKRYDAHDPFSTTSDKSREFLGQIMAYTDPIFKQQQRTHCYTLAIFGRYARIVRWDRSGCVFSEKFDYKANPAKLALFVWRLSHAATQDVRGHDITATRVLAGTDEYELMAGYIKPAQATSDSADSATGDSDKPTAGDFAEPATSDHARELFVQSLVNVDKWPWWKLTVPDSNPTKPPHEYLVGAPTFAAPGVVGRGTRGYVALDYTDPNHPFVYLKDCWRVVHDRSEQEGSILTYLNDKGVRNVPTALRHGDVGQAIAMARDVWMELHAKDSEKEECRMKNHRHYRLVVKEVGQPLRSFKNGRELAWVVLNALTAHRDAYNLANTIHRDISVGNILIMRDPTIERFGCYGLLTDWELSKRTDQKDLEPRHPDRTGTWQFMSVNALDNPGVEIGIPDEMESLFHVLLYCSIRHLPHNCREVGDFMETFFDQGVAVDALREEYTCSQLKERVLLAGQLVTVHRSPIVFLLAPLPDPPAKTVSLAANSNVSGSPSPSRPSSPTPPSRPPPQTAQAQPTPDPKIPKKDRHPMNGILKQMLVLFKARYELQNRSRSSEPGSEHKTLATINKVPKTKLLSEYLDVYAKPASHAPETIDQTTLKDFEGKAAKLEAHDEVGRILTEAAFELNGTPWPECDKTPDQLDPNYRADKEKKEDTKLGKRSTPDDGTQASSKPKRSRRSAPSRT